MTRKQILLLERLMVLHIQAQTTIAADTRAFFAQEVADTRQELLDSAEELLDSAGVAGGEHYEIG